MNSARNGEVPGRTAERVDKPVVLEAYALSSLLMAAIEIHGRESLGFLTGTRTGIRGQFPSCSDDDTED